MEEFTVKFGVSNEKVLEGDYFFHQVKINRAVVPTEETFIPENYSQHRKAVPVLCSKTIGIGDKVMIDSARGIPSLTGKIISLDRESGIAKVDVMSSDGLVVTTDDVPIDSCYFPIIEIEPEDRNTDLVEHMKVTRDMIELKTLCVKCNSTFRNTGNCETYGDECQSKNKKQLAILLK
jgi:hypothetical protein